MIYQETISEALKWGLLVFAAGFIGFFGKFLGKIVLSRFHNDHESEGKAAGSATPGPAPDQEAKALKKEGKTRLKAEKKLAKKASEDRGE